MHVEHGYLSTEHHLHNKANLFYEGSPKVEADHNKNEQNQNNANNNIK